MERSYEEKRAGRIAVWIALQARKTKWTTAGAILGKADAFSEDLQYLVRVGAVECQDEVDDMNMRSFVRIAVRD